MRNIKCKYCGKIYASPREMRKRKCRSHPNGCWGGYCRPDSMDEFLWVTEENRELTRRSLENLERMEREQKQAEAEFVRKYKKHTPLLDCVIGRGDDADEPSQEKLQIRELDLNQFARDMANGINSGTRDAINTVYALRAGCDYVLNNEDARESGAFLDSWLDKIARLKDEIVDWDFWVALYWLTRPIKDEKNSDEKNGKRVAYWLVHSVAYAFHTKQVIPMLHAVNNKGDKDEKEIMNAIKSYVRKLIAESKQKGLDSGSLRCIKTLSRRIKDYSFWGVLYCLYWMKLRPTPWNDQKVWPVRGSNGDEENPSAPNMQQAPTADSGKEDLGQGSEQPSESARFSASQHLRTFREQTLGMSKIGNLWYVNLSKCLTNVKEPFCLTSEDGDLGDGLRTRLWHGEHDWDGVAGDFLAELEWKITTENRRPFLLMAGEFHGNYPEEIYKGIDISSTDLQLVIDEFQKRFHEALYFGDGKDASKNVDYDSSHVWWRSKNPLDVYGKDFEFPGLLVYDLWCGIIRDQLAKLGEMLVKFLPFRIPINGPLARQDDSDPLKDLDALIGLGRVKDEVRKLVELVKFNAARKAKGLSAGGMTSHFVFTGNPGTGKTTVARIVADIYRQLGILKKGHLVEVDRSKLVAGYVGHTAIQTNAVVDSAMDGVLFIDEAYSLVAGGTSDFGSEAIATLLKRMEDARERIIVIVAGYSDEMSRFVKSNPGLESRFTKFIEFPDYSIDELVSIFDSIVNKNQFKCSSNAHELVRKTIEAAAASGHISGNARYVRNLFDTVRERMARRVMKINSASINQLQTIEAEDFGELVSDTTRQVLQPSAVTDEKNEPAQAQEVINFNTSEYLKGLRAYTLQLSDIWSKDGTHGWETVLADGVYLSSWQRRVQSNLCCELWTGMKTYSDSTGDFLTGPYFNISHNGETFILKVWGEFWGNWPKEKYLGIDFSADAIKSDLDKTLEGVGSAWSSFAVKGNCGCNPSNHVGEGDIWWNVAIPFASHEELVGNEFSEKLRDSLVKLAGNFAILLPYRVSVNNK